MRGCAGPGGGGGFKGKERKVPRVREEKALRVR